TGRVETHSLTVRDTLPEGLVYVSSQPPAAQEGNQCVWTLGELAGQQNRTIQMICRTTRVGAVTNVASVTTEEGLRDEKAVTTQVTAPQLKVAKTGPATGILGVPVTYQITVSNPGSAPATNVLLKDEFDDGLEHESRARPVELPVGTLGAGETRTVAIA